MRSKVFRLSADAADRRCLYYFLMAVSSSGTTPLPPHVGHCRSSSVPFSMTPSPLQSGQVFMCAACTCYHTFPMGARPWANGKCYSLVLHRFTPKAAIFHCPAHVRVGPKADIPRAPVSVEPTMRTDVDPYAAEFARTAHEVAA